MPVTEVALCRLSPNVTIGDPELRSKLVHAKTVMQEFTGRRFFVLQHIQDPSNLFIIGEWDSLDQHINHFIPGPENQEILKSLENLMTVEWLLHVDVAHADLPFPKTDKEREKAIREELVITIVRNFVVDGAKDHLEEALVHNANVLQEFVTEGIAGVGWRLDKWLGKEEYILFIPWKSLEQQLEFSRPENVSKLWVNQDLINGIEMKHTTILDI